MSSKTYFTYEEIESFVFDNEEALSEIGVNYDEMREEK